MEKHIFEWENLGKSYFLKYWKIKFEKKIGSLHQEHFQHHHQTHFESYRPKTEQLLSGTPDSCKVNDWKSFR